MWVAGLLSIGVMAMMTSADDEWSFQTYLGANISLHCNDSRLNVQQGEYVTWRAPAQTDINVALDTQLYEVRNVNNVPGLDLFVKTVNAETSGVYQCYVRSSGNSAVRTSALRGINIHDHKYEYLGDKYIYNIKVAVISTAVFLVPSVTMMLVYTFRYRSSSEKSGRKGSRDGFSNDVDGQGYSMAETVKSPEGHGAYENKGLSTQL